MKVNILQATGCALFALLVMGEAGRTEPLAPLRVTPDELKWVPAPGGLQRANMVGDDKTTGIYVYRIRAPANTKVPPHFHPDERVVIVTEGTLYMGYGEKWDESAMKALPPGSVWTEPAKAPHYVWAKDGEVVIQVMGNGPSAQTRVEQK